MHSCYGGNDSASSIIQLDNDAEGALLEAGRITLVPPNFYLIVCVVVAFLFDIHICEDSRFGSEACGQRGRTTTSCPGWDHGSVAEHVRGIVLIEP